MATIDDNRLNEALNKVLNDPAARSRIIRASAEEVNAELQTWVLAGNAVLTEEERLYCVGQAALLKAELGSDDQRWTLRLNNILNAGGPGP